MTTIDKRAKTSYVLLAKVKNYAGGYSHSFVRLANFSTYDEALAVFAAVDAQRESFQPVDFYAVRSVEDPVVVKAAHVRESEMRHKTYVDHWTISRASGDYRKRVLRDTAKWAVKTAGPNTTFDGLIAMTKNSLKDRFGYSFGSNPRDVRVYVSYDYTNYAVEQAVKDLVLIGRCPRSRKAYWLPKRVNGHQVKLHDLKCPCCNGWLAQTTLALQANFRPYPTDMLKKEAA